MFASLLRSKKSRPSESTPLLAALSRYRSHHSGAHEADGHDGEGVAQDHGEDEDEEDDDRRRDEPLLPVFSSTFLGAHRIGTCALFVYSLLTSNLSPRSHTHL